MCAPQKATVSESAVSVLLIGQFGSDSSLLQRIFRQRGWKLSSSSHPQHGLGSLRRKPVQVVVSTTGEDSWTWRDVLGLLRKVTPEPVLIVTSRIADDSLWSEVLNEGGYDVLAQPFNPNEVERVLEAARRQFAPKPMHRVAMSAHALTA